MTSAVPTSFEWILGSQVEGFIVRVVLDTSTNTFTLTSLLGSGDINALWFDNEGGGMTGPSTQLASRDNSLNMNGSGVTWDSMLKLSSAGLGQASVLGTETGASKQTFLNATGDSFSYTVDSLASWGITDWSAVTLGVRATSVNGSGSVKLVDTSANAAIVLVADTVIGNEDAGPISGNIFNNDSRVGDESTLPTINAFTVNLPGGQVSGTIGAPLILEGYGMLVLNSNGSFTFNPAQNYFGTLPVSYTVVDGNFVRTSTLTITVNPVNDAPTGTATAMLADGKEDAAYKVTAADLLQGFSDVDGDTLSVSDLSAGVNGTVLDNKDGTYTITPAANYNGPVTLSYSVIDGQGGAVAGSQSFTLTAVNDDPTGAATAVLADGKEDTAYIVTSAQLLAGFSDVDGDAMSVSDLSAGVNGTVLDNKDGTYTITPGGQLQRPRHPQLQRDRRAGRHHGRLAELQTGGGQRCGSHHWRYKRLGQGGRHPLDWRQTEHCRCRQCG
jgi:hypothetical protein